MSFKSWYNDPKYKLDSTKKSSYWSSFGGWGRGWDYEDDDFDYGALYKPAKDDKKANNTLICDDALKSISRSANAILNSGVENERKLTVKFSDDTNKNSVEDNTIYLSPDKLISAEDREQRYEIVDALCGQSMLAAQLKRQIDVITYGNFITSTDNEVRSLWSGIELAIARGDIIADWSGFKPYFDNYARYSSKVTSTSIKRELSKHNGTSEEKPTSSKALITGLAWNLYHSHDTVRIPDVYNPGKQLIAEGLADVDTSEKRWKFCVEVVNKLREMYDKEKPKTKESESSTEKIKLGEDMLNIMQAIDGLKSELAKAPSIKIKRGSDKFTGVDEELFGLKNIDNKKFKGAAELLAVSGDSTTESKDSLLAPMVPPSGRSHKDISTAYNFWVPKDKPSTTTSKFFTPKKIKDLDKMAESLKDSFGFIDKELKRKVFGMKDGVIHPGSLYKINCSNTDIFYKKTFNDTDKVSVCLLVDQSGSMGCTGYTSTISKITEAAEVAYVLAKMCKDIKNLDLSVLGFTAQENCPELRKRFSGGFNGEVNMRLIYDALDPAHSNLNDICAMRAHNNNLDGFSIWHAAKYMNETRLANKKKVLIVVSDGCPNGRGYEGASATEHVNICRKDAKNKFGVDVYAIGIANAYSKEEGDAMYGAGRNIVISDVKSSLGYLSRFLNQVSKT